jgi:predicted nucleic acid-binding protein
MPSKPLLYFDTVVLSNFAFIKGGITFLQKRYQQRGNVTLQVLEELAKATYSGFNQLEEVEKNLFNKKGFVKTSLAESEQPAYILLLKNLGNGEASCIACASKRKGIVVTDCRMARNSCKEHDIAVTGTLGILKSAYLDGILQIDEADAMLKQMVDFGFYSPVQKISDML